MAADAANLDARRRQLPALRDQLVANDAAAEEMRAPVKLDQESVGRLSRIDAMQVRAMALAAQRHRQAECNRIDAALKRIDSGDYGWCIRCGDEIEAKGLDHGLRRRCASPAPRRNGRGDACGFPNGMVFWGSRNRSQNQLNASFAMVASAIGRFQLPNELRVRR